MIDAMMMRDWCLLANKLEGLLISLDLEGKRKGDGKYMDMDFWHWLGLLLGLLFIASMAIPIEFWYNWIEKRENRRLERKLKERKEEGEEVLLEEVLLMPGQELRLKLELPEQGEENGNKSGKESGEDWW